MTEPSREVERHVDVAEIVDRLGEQDLGGAERTRLLARLSVALLAGARAAGVRAVLTGRALADAVAELAPHVRVRDLATLRAAHGGLADGALADALVSAAARTTAGIGAAGGALSAASYAAPPALLASPVQLAAETVAVVLVELRLVAELHVVHGIVAPGGTGQQAAAYLQAWVGRRAVDAQTGGVTTVMRAAARQQLRGRLVRRFGRNITTLAPLLVGAFAGAELNRRETRALGEAVSADLGRQPPRG